VRFGFDAASRATCQTSVTDSPLQVLLILLEDIGVQWGSRILEVPGGCSETVTVRRKTSAMSNLQPLL
jgi:hypothetical protein